MDAISSRSHLLKSRACHADGGSEEGGQISSKTGLFQMPKRLCNGHLRGREVLFNSGASISF